MSCFLETRDRQRPPHKPLKTEDIYSVYEKIVFVFIYIYIKYMFYICFTSVFFYRQDPHRLGMSFTFGLGLGLLDVGELPRRQVAGFLRLLGANPKLRVVLRLGL